MNVGVIGLGRMGAPMARHVVEAGHRVHVYDLRPAAIAGATVCGNTAEVAAVSDIVVTSLPGPAQVEAVMREVLGAVRRDAVIVETSTIGPAQSQSLAAQFAARDAAYLDAPVSGGVEGAVAGTLAVMVGGEAATLERARPVIQCFGQHIFHLGPVGVGNSMKLVIQTVFLSQVAALVEAVAVGREAGIPVQRLLEVIAASSAHHPAIGKRYDKIIADDLTPRFEVQAALKDLGLAQQWSHQLGCRVDVLDATIAAYRRAAAAGFSEQDLIALQQVIRPART
jgi:3-hydroxyisobutyrate dehydrogenase-like beta-hydroxyacid dehydrogenase